MALTFNREILSRLSMGVVVAKADMSDVGHIIGFSTNVHKELTVVVRWAVGEAAPIHPANLIVID